MHQLVQIYYIYFHLVCGPNFGAREFYDIMKFSAFYTRINWAVADQG